MIATKAMSPKAKLFKPLASYSNHGVDQQYTAVLETVSCIMWVVISREVSQAIPITQSAAAQISYQHSIGSDSFKHFLCFACEH